MRRVQKSQYEGIWHELDLISSLDNVIKRLGTNCISNKDRIDQLASMQKHVQALRQAFDSSKFLMHHRHLMLDLASLMDDVLRGRIDRRELQGCLKVCREDAVAIEDIFRVDLQYRPEVRNYWRDESSTIAQEVFAIPEILEMILLQTPVKGVINFSQTCTEARDIIDASPGLQTHLCLRPAPPDSIRRHPFTSYEVSNLECGMASYRYGCVDQFRIARVEVQMDPDGVYWPYIGDRLLDMFICQPPIYRLLVFESCPLDDAEMFGFDPGFQMVSKTGVTIGDVFSVAEKLLMFHDSCRKPESYHFYGSEPYRATVSIRFQEPSSEQEWDRAANSTVEVSESWAEQYGEQFTGVFGDAVLGDYAGSQRQAG